MTEVDYDFSLSVVGSEHLVFDNKSNRIQTSEYDDLMRLIQITGINTILYCKKVDDESVVRDMYYVDGGSTLANEFMEKYLTGMRLKYDLLPSKN